MKERIPNVARFTKKEARSLLIIDKNNLDEACTHQANLFYEVSYRYAHAKSIKDRAKEELTLVFSRKYLEERRDAERVGKKTTEEKLKSLVKMSKEYKQAFDGSIEATKDYDEWGALKDAFLQRASMIRDLCNLYLNNYYADITVKGSESSSDDVKYKQKKERVTKARKEKHANSR
jgi:hypothetical protein